MILVQWNTHHGGIGSDGVLNTARLGAALAPLNPDVVCLNEVEQFDGYGNHDCVGIWTSALGPGWTGLFVNVSGVVGGKGQGNAILTKLPPQQPVVGKGLWQGRCALATKVQWTAGLVPIVGTHLSNVSANDREVQQCQILGWDQVNHVSPMVLCGDWNAHQGNVEIASLYAWYTDAWVAAQKIGQATSFNGTGATHGTSRIDMVFVRGLTVQHVTVPDTRIAGVYPSDHNPVVVTLA